MKIALVQQYATKDPGENLDRGVAAFHQAVEAGAQLVAFAELAFLPFLPQAPATPESVSFAENISGPTVDKFQKLAKKNETVVVLNIYETDGKNTYDSSPVIDADGTLLGTTRMVHIMDGMGFYEKGYYTPGNVENFVYQTRFGRVGVSICYDRHFPEYMRNLGLLGAEIVFIPQAGAVGEWPEGLFQAEVQVAAFQNGYFAALVNRVGKEDFLCFSGESFVVGPEGNIIAQAPQGQDFILYADCDLSKIAQSPAKKYFIPDRRPDFYKTFNLDKKD
ncbi:MAG: carbon-nitrogen hydrolase family protein [Candidatus Aminicenantes bacterium]|nr:MAG: carbon-nitrogen hydrolase family protein [Candidatus Aminicenantes bacterium]